MENTLEFKVHKKENIYFAIKVLAAILGYLLIFFSIAAAFNSPSPMVLLPLIFYAVIIVLYVFISFAVMIGHIRGNAVKITNKQFPDIHDIVIRQCRRLNMEVPEVYLLQSGGVLNAFATRFVGSNYVVIYSDILEEAFDGNKESVEFVIGHELGHLKRRHHGKSLYTFPSIIIPFLNAAYSRSCEYTCDNIGAALCPQGASQGILLLASGKKLWKKVNGVAFIEQGQNETSFWYWFAEKFARHPHLVKRLKEFKLTEKVQHKPLMPAAQIFMEKTSGDHSSYLPKN